MLLSRNAVEIDKIVHAGCEKAGKNARVKIGARGRIDISELGPAEIALVLRANQSRDMARVPAERKQYPDKSANKRRPQQEIIWLLECDARAGRQNFQRLSIVSFRPKFGRMLFLRVEPLVKFCQLLFPVIVHHFFSAASCVRDGRVGVRSQISR